MFASLESTIARRKRENKSDGVIKRRRKRIAANSDILMITMVIFNESDLTQASSTAIGGISNNNTMDRNARVQRSNSTNIVVVNISS
jgi:hypothetical protein